MIRSSILVWAILAIAVAGALFRVSYRVQHLEKHLASVNRDIGREEETIRVLQAEWSYLNNPARIEELARKHLALVPTTNKQIATLDTIPSKSSKTIPATPLAKAAPAPEPAPANPTKPVVLAKMQQDIPDE